MLNVIKVGYKKIENTFFKKSGLYQKKEIKKIRFSLVLF